MHIPFHTNLSVFGPSDRNFIVAKLSLGLMLAGCRFSPTEMNFKRPSALAGLIAGLVLAGSGFAQDPVNPSTTTSIPPTSTHDEPLALPKMTVNSSRLQDFPPIPKTELKGGGLAPSEPPVNLQFPGSAYAASITKGYATVCVELDKTGKAVDFLLVSYTEKYFGDALMRNAKDTKYSALLYKGVAVPSRFNFGYEFRPEYTVAMNGFDAIQRRQQEIRGGRPDFKYYPVTEEALDNRLEYVEQAVPNFPAGYKPAGGKLDWVLVSFYVDEQGNVRVPSVDSASSPLLIPNAIKAVHYWKFKPPTVKGKPALVYAAFAVNFMQAK